MSRPCADFTDVLVRRRIISRRQQREVRRLHQNIGIRLEDALIKFGYATAEGVQSAVAELHRLPCIDLRRVTIPLSVIELVPASVARENLILPVALEDGVLTVAMSDPTDRDTILKLQFILNKDVRPVLASREQIVEAIDRYYGASETESVDSMLREFTDTAIDFPEESTDFELSDELDDGACQVLEEAVPGAATSPPLVARHATVRYYDRMNPERMFPLLVVISRGVIERIVKKHVAQGQSRQFQVALESLVEVEPVLPGCSCYPPKDHVRIGQGAATATVWVVPHVLGKVMQARVVLRQDGRTLAEVPLEVRVRRQGLTFVTGVLSLVLPFVLLLMKHFRLDFESQLADGFGLYAALAGWALRSLSPEVVMGLLLAVAVGLYFRLRPRRRDVFWDITPVAPAPGGSAAPPSARGNQAELLTAADRHFNAGDYPAALDAYKAALAQGKARPAAYFRASLAAGRTGDSARALAIFQEAELMLPPEEFSPALWYNRACFSARLGRFDNAMRYLHRAVDQGYARPWQLETDPDLEPLRWRKDFRQLLTGLRREAGAQRTRG